jgi:hypothetical protein
MKRITFICNDELENQLMLHNEKWGSNQQSVIEIALKKYFKSLTTIDDHCESAYRESQCKS